MKVRHFSVEPSYTEKRIFYRKKNFLPKAMSKEKKKK